MDQLRIRIRIRITENIYSYSYSYSKLVHCLYRFERYGSKGNRKPFSIHVYLVLEPFVAPIS